MHPWLLTFLDGVRVVRGANDADVAMTEVASVLSGNPRIRMIDQTKNSVCVEVADWIITAVRGGVITRLLAGGQSALMLWQTLTSAIGRGVNVCRPVALVASRDEPIRYVIQHRPKDALGFADWLMREKDRMSEQPVLERRVTKDFGAFVGDLHRLGYVSEMTLAQDLLIQPPRNGMAARFILRRLDPSGLRSRPASVGERVKHLAALSLVFAGTSNTTRRRFLRRYCVRVEDEKRQSALAREVAVLSDDLQFERNARLVANCDRDSSLVRRVDAENITLLVNRTSSDAHWSELEGPLGQTPADDWADVIERHLALRFGDATIYQRFIASRRDSRDSTLIQDHWGRWLELSVIGRFCPDPLACLVIPEGLILFGRTSGELHPVSGIRDVDRLDVFEAMGCALDQMHRFGVFIGAGDVDDMIRDWSLAIGPRGGRQLVFTGFGDTFRGTPNRLGSQALASLARVSRGVAQNAGMRQMKELVWAYARRNRLNALDTSHLMDEVRTIPVATNLVIHPGIRRSQRIQEPA